MRKADIAVTGMGGVTPLGGDVPSTWAGLLAGRGSARRISTDITDRFDLPVTIACQLTSDPAQSLDRVVARRLDRCEQIAVVAANQAWADAGIGADVDPYRVGVVIGTGMGGIRTLFSQYERLASKGAGAMSPLTLPMMMPNGPAANVAIVLGARAGAHTPSAACASGAEAIAWAWRMLRADDADVVIAGGTDANITGATLAAFARIHSLSTRNDEPERASRPWDVNRDGFVLGEGAGILVLERAEHARARNAKVYAWLAGVGTTSDAYHITAPEPTGQGQAMAIGAAIRSACLSPIDIVHVNAHATATPVGDIPETMAIRKAIGDHPVLTGPKGALGHLLGGAGAVEAIATVLTLRSGIIPPTANLDDLDPAVCLDVVVDRPRHVKMNAAISNSSGFGGHNVALAFTVN